MEKYIDKDKNSFSKIITIIVLCIIFLVILAVFVGIFIGKKTFRIRKTKVNELLELYDYSSKEKSSDNQNSIIK